jgi:hypothetical protein
MKNDGFTATQRKMLEVLSDGLPHSREELHACLPDELGPLSNIRAHLVVIRKVLLRRGEHVAAEMGWKGKISYRHVRLLKGVCTFSARVNY